MISATALKTTDFVGLAELKAEPTEQHYEHEHRQDKASLPFNET